MQYKFYLSAIGQNIINQNCIIQSTCHYSNVPLLYDYILNNSNCHNTKYGIHNIQSHRLTVNLKNYLEIFIFNYPVINFNYFICKTYKMANKYKKQ